jgi:hypothetical protein
VEVEDFSGKTARAVRQALAAFDQPVYKTREIFDREERLSENLKQRDSII